MSARSVWQTQINGAVTASSARTARCGRSVEQQLVQTICLACSKPLINSQEDPAIRIQLLKDLAEFTKKDGKYEWKPNCPLGTVIKKEQL
jgi:hypothetical protein